MSYEVKQQQVKELGEKLIAIAEPKQGGNVDLVRLICLVQSNMNMAAKGELTDLQLDEVISKFSHNISALDDGHSFENFSINHEWCDHNGQYFYVVYLRGVEIVSFNDLECALEYVKSASKQV